jgi:hypothetical protein
MAENVLSVCKKHAKNGIEITISFKSASVCLVSVSKGGTKSEQLTAISHRGIPDTINELVNRFGAVTPSVDQSGVDPDVLAAFK